MADSKISALSDSSPAATGDQVPINRGGTTGRISWPQGLETTSNPTFANGIYTGTLTVTGGFGCNTKTAQTAYVSGGALAAYGAGANGFDTGANASALHALVVAIRAALVANGIMS